MPEIYVDSPHLRHAVNDKDGKIHHIAKEYCRPIWRATAA